MKERPILFSGGMVRAILEGRNTQTRRIIKPQPETDGSIGPMFRTPGGGWCSRSVFQAFYKNPYGQPGDRLWVRETWLECRCGSVSCEGFQYKADDQGGNSGWKWKPSIHMPRWASRLVLEISNVKVERLNDISEDEAKSEGCKNNIAHLEKECAYLETFVATSGHGKCEFKRLWESINGPGAWGQNPWVWVIEFKPVDK